MRQHLLSAFGYTTGMEHKLSAGLDAHVSYCKEHRACGAAFTLNLKSLTGSIVFGNHAFDRRHVAPHPIPLG